MARLTAGACKIAVLAMVALLLVLSLALAQVADAPDKRLDQARGQLDQIEAALARQTLSDEALLQLRQQLDPVSDLVEAVIAELTPTLAAIKSRLDQLIPKTADKPAAEKPPADAPSTESPAAIAERAEQEKLFKDIDGAVRRARALQVETAQTINTVQQRRRGLFTQALFEQSSSLFRPGLWLEVIGGLPHDIKATNVVAGDFYATMIRKLEGWRLPVLGGLLALAVGMLWPAILFTRRFLLRQMQEASPPRLKKVVAAAICATLILSVPLAFLAVAAGLATGFSLSFPTAAPLLTTMAEAVARVSITAALAIAVLQPERPGWRLAPVDDSAAIKITRLAWIIAVILSLTKIASALADVIGAGLPLLVAVRGTGALLVALAIGQSLDALADGESEKGKGAAPPPPHAGPLRLLAWLLSLAIIAAVVVGYIAFGSFLVEQVIWVGCIIAALFLLLALAEAGIPAVLEPQAPFGRFLFSTIGLHSEALQQIEVILGGIAQLGLYALAALLVVAPWGVQPDDYFGSLRTAFFGFKLGEVTISLSSIILALVVFGLALAVTRAVQRWLEVRFLPHTKLHSGLRNSIKTSLGYVGFVVAASLALSNVGLSLERVAFVAGALSVGIGFGLQSIVNNFVSGLILLWEGAIRVGDWIVVGEDQGIVRRINVRSTEIETFERSMVIVPNSSLVSGVVKNWVRGDRIGRVKIVLSLANTADVNEMRELLIKIVKDHEAVMKIPAPAVLFADLNETGARLELFCYVEEVEQAARVRSDLLFELHKRLNASGQIGMLASNALNLSGLAHASGAALKS